MPLVGCGDTSKPAQTPTSIAATASKARAVLDQNEVTHLRRREQAIAALLAASTPVSCKLFTIHHDTSDTRSHSVAVARLRTHKLCRRSAQPFEILVHENPLDDARMTLQRVSLLPFEAVWCEPRQINLPYSRALGGRPPSRGYTQCADSRLRRWRWRPGRWPAACAHRVV